MSITTETRREAHEEMAPKRRARQVAILSALRRYGAMTSEELVDRLLAEGAIDRYDLNAVSPRLTELKELGEVEVTGKRKSRISGRSTAVWAIK